LILFYTEVQIPRCIALVLQVAGFDEEDGGASPSHKKGSRAGRREGRVKGKGVAEGEPGAAIAGATLRISSWPPNDQEVVNTAFQETLPVTVLQHSSMHCVAAKIEWCCPLTQCGVAPLTQSGVAL